ncbi:MAG: hypothetical protein U0R64_04735 [Candidatus Nanopelagicales bacterium]
MRSTVARRLRPVAVAIALCVVAGGIAPRAEAARRAPAGGADAIVASGLCSGGASWSLKARAAGRGIQVTGRVQSRPGQRWRFVAEHNGVRALSGVRSTGGRGAFTVRRHTANLPGVDSYTFTARRKGGGAVCWGSLSY